MAAGLRGSDAFVAHYTVGGGMDLAFRDGIVSTDLGGYDTSCSLALMPDGRAVVAGHRRHDYDLAVLRYEMSTTRTERLYVQQDANFNVTSLTSVWGGVIERYLYDSYGQRTVLNADWSLDSSTGDGLSDVDNRNGHQGGREDIVTGFIHFRWREFSCALGRWTSADPLGYPDGMSRYEAYRSSPGQAVDPGGLCQEDPKEAADEINKIADQMTKELLSGRRPKTAPATRPASTPAAAKALFDQLDVNDWKVRDAAAIQIQQALAAGDQELADQLLRLKKNGSVHQQVTLDRLLPTNRIISVSPTKLVLTEYGAPGEIHIRVRSSQDFVGQVLTSVDDPASVIESLNLRERGEGDNWEVIVEVKPGHCGAATIQFRSNQKGALAPGVEVAVIVQQ